MKQKMNKIILVLMSVFLLYLVGCSYPEPYRDNYQSMVSEETIATVPQNDGLNSTKRAEQVIKFNEDLFKKYRQENDLLTEKYETFAEKMRLNCDGARGVEIEICFNKIQELIDEAEKESTMLLDFTSDSAYELIDKAQFTNENLTEEHERLSEELSKKAEEGRLRLEDSYRELSSPSKATSYKVTRVIDGDTIELSTGETVRLIGIDTPEIGETCYEEAKEYLEEFLSGKEITLGSDIEDKDHYGRLLRYVYADGHNVNYGMILLGYAYAYEYGENTKNASWFKEAEEEARKTGGCLWDSNGAVGVQESSDCAFNKYNCPDFKTHKEAQTLFESCGGTNNDIHQLDGDKDGLACETLP